MKNILSLTICFMVMLISLHTSAQTKKKSCMPEQGYWVIENNIKTPRHNTVYYYTNNQELIHKELITGRKLNTKRKKIVKQLNEVFMQVYVAWQRKELKNTDQVVRGIVN